MAEGLWKRYLTAEGNFVLDLGLVIRNSKKIQQVLISFERFKRMLGFPLLSLKVPQTRLTFLNLEESRKILLCFFLFLPRFIKL